VDLKNKYLFILEIKFSSQSSLDAFNPLIIFICVYTHYLWGLQGPQTITINFVTE